MQIKELLSNKGNYSTSKKSKIEFIVVHYTANDGDTAFGNATYFKNNKVGASANLFVDDFNCYMSVPLDETAWHCGANSYKHPKCRNSNSIGVEMCSKKDVFGDYYISDKTISHTIDVVKYLMEKYNIPPTNILRHYDVTGKRCPEPFVRNEQIWNDFLKELCKNMTVEEAKVIIKQKCGFSDTTIQYLDSYKYGDSMIIRLAEAMKG